MLYRKFRMLRGHYVKMTRGLFPKRIIRYAGLTEPPMCTSAYLANVRPDHISSSYWFRSKKCSGLLCRLWVHALRCLIYIYRNASPDGRHLSETRLAPHRESSIVHFKLKIIIIIIITTFRVSKKIAREILWILCGVRFHDVGVQHN